MAMDFHRRGAYDDARRLYRLCLIAAPDHIDAIHLLGVSYYQQDKPDLAVRYIDRAIASLPGRAHFYANLSLALFDLKRYQEALRATVLALILDPGHGPTIVNHGSASRECGDMARAFLYGARGLALTPNLFAAHSAYGMSLYFAKAYDEALGRYKTALSLSPAEPRALYIMGLILSVTGRPGAAATLGAAWRLSPYRTDFCLSFAEVHKFKRGDGWLERLEDFIPRLPELTQIDQTLIHFTLAKAYDGVGENDKAFEHRLAGGRIKRQQVDYDESVTLGMFDAILDLFTPEFMAARNGWGDPSDLPIFIVGMPRSGTSMIEQVLDSHPDVFGAGELHEVAPIIDRFTTAETGLFPGMMPDLSNEDLTAAGRDYLAQLAQRAPGVRHITDKLPGNLPFAGFIHLALPNARIIQVRRDPVECCLSCFSTLFTDLGYTYDLGELGRFANRYQKLMDLWEKAIPADRLMSVRYEEFVENQEAETRRLLEFCGLPWDDACLSFHENKRVVHTASIHQVRKPLYKTSLRRWRPADHLLEPLMRGLRGED